MTWTFTIRPGGLVLARHDGKEAVFGPFRPRLRRYFDGGREGWAMPFCEACGSPVEQRQVAYRELVEKRARRVFERGVVVCQGCGLGTGGAK